MRITFEDRPSKITDIILWITTSMVLVMAIAVNVICYTALH